MSGEPPISQRPVDAPIGVFPPEWEVKQLGENAYIKARIGWRGLSADEYTKDGPLLVAGKHIRGAHIDWRSCDHISEFRYEESPEIQLRDGDVILSKDGTLGRIGIVERLPGKATINGTMMLVRPNHCVITSKFLYYYLQGRNFRKFIKEKVSGSSVPHIFQRDMVRLLVPAPPLPEQRKIAAILSSVDGAIEKTQAVIDQVQVVKRGLMQQLLTRGLPGRHTRFKQTEIGEIPLCWQLAVLDDVLEGIEAGWSPKCEGRPAELGEWGVLKVSSVSTGLFKQHENKALDKELEARPQVEVRRGDILLARASGVLALVGRSAFVHRTRPKLMLSDKTLRLQAKKSAIRSMFLNLLLEDPRVHQQVLMRTTGSHMRNISQRALRRVPIPVPSLKEQEHIEMLNVYTSTRLEQETNFLRQLEVAKSALMSVLLTGELRVTLDAEAS